MGEAIEGYSKVIDLMVIKRELRHGGEPSR
jgi:hypothetical protein